MSRYPRSLVTKLAFILGIALAGTSLSASASTYVFRSSVPGLRTSAGTAHGSVSFTTVGTSNWTVPAGVSSVGVLVVAGGGGGGADGGSGGGGGGVICQTAYAVSPGQVLSVTVGAGGTNTTEGAGGRGGNSIFGTLTAVGGGGGGGSGASTPATSGGSGGGGIRWSLSGAAGTTGQGYAGGTSSTDIGFPLSYVKVRSATTRSPRCTRCASPAQIPVMIAMRGWHSSRTRERCSVISCGP